MIDLALIWVWLMGFIGGFAARHLIELWIRQRPKQK